MDGNISKKRRYQSNKSTKHLLERQRRARINHSLGELKSLVLSAIHQGNPQADLNGCEKMEKAEILELTVNYIKAIRSHGNLGEWKMECASHPNPECNCFRNNTRSKVKSTEILCREANPPNYRTHQPTSSTLTTTLVQSRYHCVDGKPFCACVNNKHYGLVTPPLSPAMSGACVNAQQGMRTQAGALHQWKSPSSQSPPNSTSSTTNKVWRPW